VEAICRFCPNLRSLDLSSCRWVDDACLKAIGTSLRRLKVLKLAGCFSMTLIGIQHLAGGCARLEYLDLTRSYKIEMDSALEYLARGTPSLSTLMLGGCALSDTGCEFIANLSSLERLDLPADSATSNSFTSRGLQTIAQGCLKLHTLDLTRSEEVDTEYLKRLFSHCPIKKLIVKNCSQINDHGLKAIASSRHRDKLESLDLTSCYNVTDTGIQHLVKCPNLKSLCLRSCLHVSDHALRLLDGHVGLSCISVPSEYLVSCFDSCMDIV